MKFFAPISKMDPQEDGSLIVVGRATDETLDSQGEVVKFDAAVKAFQEWDARNIREMHDPHKAVGKALDVMVDEPNKAVDIRVRISAGATDTQAKIMDGTLSGFSIGGEVHEGGRTTATKNGSKVVELSAFSLSEVSVVDAPANPSATFQLAKVSDGEVVFTEMEATTEKAAEPDEIEEEAAKAEAEIEAEKAEDAEEEETEEKAEDDPMDKLMALTEKVEALEARLADAEAEKAATEKASDEATEKTDNDAMPGEAPAESTTKVTAEEAALIGEIMARHTEAAISEIMEAIGKPMADDEMPEDLIVEEAEKSATPTGEVVAKAKANDISKAVERMATKLEKSLDAIAKRVETIEAQPDLGNIPVKHEGAIKQLAGMGMDVPSTDSNLAESLLKSIPEGEEISKEALAQKLAFMQIANAQRGNR